MNAVEEHRPAHRETARGSIFLLPRPIIARNLALKSASEVVARVIQFGFIVVVVRCLGTRGFGLYSFAAALGFVLAQFSDLGLQLYVAREIARAPERRSQILGAALRCKVILFALCVVFLSCYAGIQQSVIERDVLFVLALAVALTSFLELLNYAFRGYQRLEFEAALNLAARLMGPGIAMPALVYGASLRTVAWILLLANIAAVALGYHWLTRRFTRPDWRVKRSESWHALTQVLPLGIAIVSSALYARTGVLVLTRSVSLDAAGWFNAAHRLTEPLQLLPAIALAAIYPAFAALEDVRRQQSLAHRTFIALLLLSFAVSLPLWLGARVITASLYGPDFKSSEAALRWLALSVMPTFLNYALTHFMVARGRAWFNALFNSVVLIENVSLNAWLDPRFGASGAAVSMLASELTLFALCVLGYRRAMTTAANCTISPGTEASAAESVTRRAGD